MRYSVLTFLLACLLSATGAFAQDSPQRTEAEATGVGEGVELAPRNFELKPHAGAIFFDGNERFAGGLLTGIDILNVPLADAGRMTVGPEVGAIFSSTTGGDFFSGVNFNNSEYIFQLPGNLRASFVPNAFDERMHIGVHGGVNVVRSTTTEAQGGPFGETVAGTTPGDASWDARPNVGGEVGYEIVSGLDVSIRPDVTFLPDFNMVTTTLGFGLRL